MTEIIKIPETREIRPVAFVAALILAPLSLALPAYGIVALVAATGGRVDLVIPLLFPIGAAWIGAPTYLTFGAFSFRRALKRGGSSARSLVLAGLRAHAVSAPLVLIPLTLTEPSSDVLPNAVAFLFLGLIFAPLWSAIFALLYERFTR